MENDGQGDRNENIKNMMNSLESFKKKKRQRRSARKPFLPGHIYTNDHIVVRSCTGEVIEMTAMVTYVSMKIRHVMENLTAMNMVNKVIIAFPGVLFSVAIQTKILEIIDYWTRFITDPYLAPEAPNTDFENALGLLGHSEVMELVMAASLLDMPRLTRVAWGILVAQTMESLQDQAIVDNSVETLRGIIINLYTSTYNDSDVFSLMRMDSMRAALEKETDEILANEWLQDLKEESSQYLYSDLKKDDTVSDERTD